jgi:Fe-Mn family superoxide dismutase
MSTLTQTVYTAKKWDLSGLQGISDNTLQTHFGLYEGYVKNTNLLNEQLNEMLQAGKAVGADPHFAELKRRMGFEFNGMRLHEYYFDNLTSKGSGDIAKGAFAEAVEKSFGSVELWKKDFSAVGTMRGVGWAICYLDPTNGRVSNNWISLHEDGNVSGLVPLVVMDVWEHAFLLDYKPSERSKYIESFFANVNWNVPAQRIAKVSA